MEANYDFNEEMIDNQDKFSADFFSKFTLRPAARPLQLTADISKNYLFPTLYSDVACAVGIFLCSYDRAYNLVSQTFGPKVKPIKMTLNRSIVAFSCYHYRNVMNIGPYNEIAMTLPIMVDSLVDLPVLPIMMDKFFPNFGYYVFGMPVTSKENQIRGNRIWGLPKVTQPIDIEEQQGECVIVAKEESGEPYFKLRVPMDGKPTPFDVTSNLYSRLDGQLLQSETNFKANFKVKKYITPLFRKNATPDRTYLILGDSPSAQILKQLEIEMHPFQFRYAETMNSCFDLPKTDFKSPIVLP